MKVLAAKPHGVIDYCGQCGRTIFGVPKWGFGWESLPFLLFGEPIYDAPVAVDIIRAGDMLVIPLCTRRCQREYRRIVEEKSEIFD